MRARHGEHQVDGFHDVSIPTGWQKRGRIAGPQCEALTRRALP